MYKIRKSRFRLMCLEEKTQPEMAEHFNRTTATISSWINNPERIPLGTFLKICEYIGADPNEFIESAE